MQRNIIRQFRFNKEENEVLKEKAKKCCITDSALVRMLVLGFIPKPKPEKEFYDALRYLSSMSNSLHQISAKANALNFIDVPKLDKTIESVEKLKEDLQNIQKTTKFQKEEMITGYNYLYLYIVE